MLRLIHLATIYALAAWPAPAGAQALRSQSPLASPPPMTSQAADDSMVSLPTRAGAWVRHDEPRRITEETIFDYMDGAGELYLAYRFSHLDVTVYTAPEKTLGEIRVELYWMRSPDDAFGLLSVDWGGEPVDLTAHGAARDAAVPTVPPHDALYGGGLLRFQSGRLYGRVMASRESPASRDQVLAIARSIVKGRSANGPPPGILRKVPERLGDGFTLRPDRTCFFRSHYVLNSIHYLAPDDVLGLGPEVDAVIGEYRAAPPGTGPIRLIAIAYATPDAAEAGMAAFLRSLPPGDGAAAAGRAVPSAVRGEGGWFGWAARDRYLTIVIGTSVEAEAKAMAVAALTSINRQ